MLPLIRFMLALGLGAGIVVGSCKSQTIQAVPPEVSSPISNEQPALFFSKNRLAIFGTDPVAYFTQGQAITGQPEHQHEWGGVIWQFVSADHLELFSQNPEKYAPQYGGYCAWAVSQGAKAPSDPQAWSIVNGKLYLNLNQTIQARWEKNAESHIAQADENWPAIAN